MREGWSGDLIQCLVHGIITQSLARWALIPPCKAQLLLVRKIFTQGSSQPPSVADVLLLIRGRIWVGGRLLLPCMAQLSFQVFYFSLHGLMIVSPSGYKTTYLGTTLAGLGSMYASLMIPSIAWICSRVRRIILPLRANRFRPLRVSLVGIPLVWT